MRFEHSLIESAKYKDEYYCNIINDLGVSVGFCKYCRDNIDYGAVYIEYITIYTEHRRKGYATLMVKELMTKYRLHWDYSFTQEGRLWYQKLIDRKILK